MMPIAVRGALVLVVIWSLCGMACAQTGAAPLALVLAPRTEDAALIEVASRVRGELSAAGFEVVAREAPSGIGPRRAIEDAGADLAPSAVLWIVAAQGHTSASPSLEIWLSDRLLGRVSMARLSGAAGASWTPNVLAVQAAELLRARLSELRVEPAQAVESRQSAAGWEEQQSQREQPRLDSTAKPSDLAPRPTAESRPWLGLSGGLAYLFGSGSLRGALAPVLSLWLGLGEPSAGRAPLAFDLHASAAAFGARERVRAELGSAQVDHALGSVSAALRLVTRVPLEPSLSVGAGVYSLGVSGQSELPYRSHHERYWTPFGSLGLGLRSRPFAHLSLRASAELLLAMSHAALRVAGAEIAHAGGVMWLMRAELQGVF